MATVLTVTASLLVAGAAGSAQADPKPTDPSITTFPKPEDPDAPLRAASEEAKKQNKPVPVEAAFTETSRVWAYPDGHFTTLSYGGPAQLKQANGSWAWLDPTLVEQDGVLKPKLAKANVEFSLGGDKPFVSVERGKGQKFALSWPTELPRPEVSGNVARYVDAAGKGADLVVTALPTGFQHDVVLRERPAGPLEFRFPVESTGAELSLTKSGGLSLVSPKGKTVMSAPTPRMWDNVDPAAEGQRRETKVKTSVETAGDQTVLVLKPDPKWLADPATRYPVTVDPTTTLGITQEVGIRSPNRQSSPGYVSRSTSTSSGDLISRALMAFDTAPIAGRNVVKATMQLMLREDVTTCNQFQGIAAQRITSAWVANNTFWSNQPSSTGEGRSVIDPCALPRTTGSVWSWDLTTMTQLWASGTPNHGLMLRLTSESPVPVTGESFAFWAQLWGQNVPKLSVDWVLPPEIPTVTAESIDSMSGNDAIARSTNVKVTYKSGVPEATPLDYTVTVNDSTMPPPPVQLPTGETALWKLDEASGATAADSSGNGNTGTVTGTYSRVPGQLGRAVNLAPGALLSAGKPLINTDQTYTVATWVRLNSSINDQAVLSQMGTHMPAFTLGYTVSGAAEFDRRWMFSTIAQDNPDRIQETLIQSEKLAKIGQWTHLAVQYDQAAHKVRLYVDGELAGERDYTANWNARGAFQVGTGRILGTLEKLDGAVDDLRVYQRALTAQEIRALVVSTNTTTHTGISSGQVIDKTFTMDNPASFKFVVKACRTGVTPPSCNESPAYRITSDAPMLPSDTETGMADPTQPILSGMVSRPSGGPVTAKYYLYDDQNVPVGAAPLGSRTVNGGERASFQIPPNTVQAGRTYRWQMVACATGPGDSTGEGVDEVCTPKTVPVSFTTPGTPPPPLVEDVRHLMLGKDSLVIKAAKTDAAACDGSPCTVTDAPTMQIGGAGTGKVATVVGFKLDEMPDGAGVTTGTLKLGTPTCPAGTCPADAVITVTPLKSAVTSETKGSDLAGDIVSDTKFDLPLSNPQADIAGSEYQWLLLTSNKDEVIAFGDAAAAEQPSLALSYLPAGPPSKVMNLAVKGGDTSATASWGLPEKTGSIAVIEGYDVEVRDASGVVVKTLTVNVPYALISGLVNDVSYTVRVRAKTVFGASEWESATATTKAVPPPAAGGGCVLEAQTAKAAADSPSYVDRVKAYYQAQDAVLEGRANTIWDAPGISSQAPSAAKLSLLNTELVTQREAMQEQGQSRVNSAVTIDDVAVQPGADGTVRVTAATKRTWQYESAGAAVAASDDPGQVEPGEFTISVFVFDRCGNITVIEMPLDCEEDSTDFGDYCPGTVEGSSNLRATAASSACSDGSGSASAGPQLPCKVDDFKHTIQCEVRDDLGAKGWIARSIIKSFWVHKESDWETWPIGKEGRSVSYENTTVLEPKNGKSPYYGYGTEFAKKLARSLSLKHLGGACFITQESSVQPSVGLALSPESAGLGLNVGVSWTRDAGEKCSTYGYAKRSGSSVRLVEPQALILAECTPAAGEDCWIQRYKHYLASEYYFDFKYTSGSDNHPPVEKRYQTRTVRHTMWCQIYRDDDHAWTSGYKPGTCQKKSTLTNKPLD
ncbi:LamG-like jellyroll fold domain-containing protein [Nonomuraea angiospora]|uniref:LamG-like jellyroll fold domain-containing protein n=1 Tax=Nonomuraea angiospora TaxID=46172 RepID=UPI00344E5679